MACNIKNAGLIAGGTVLAPVLLTGLLYAVSSLNGRVIKWVKPDWVPDIKRYAAISTGTIVGSLPLPTLGFAYLYLGDDTRHEPNCPDWMLTGLDAIAAGLSGLGWLPGMWAAKGILGRMGYTTTISEMLTLSAKSALYSAVGGTSLAVVVGAGIGIWACSSGR